MELENPERASAGVNILNNIKSMSAHKATRSERILPFTKKMIKSGFSAAVYTQVTDVEGEVNGLMTYDRKVVKMEEDRIRKVNREICNSLE